jgi:hypothetical protein
VANLPGVTPRRPRICAPEGQAPRWPSDAPRSHRLLRALTGVALAVPAFGLARALPRAAALARGSNTVLSLDVGLMAFLVGMGLFSLAYVALPRPTRLYVLGHELTHALFAWLQGARVRDLRVRDDRGSIRISHAHWLTLLAPYFFPLYTVLLLLALLLLSAFVPITPYRTGTLGLIGVFWGFHFCFTVNSLLQHQTDVQRCGAVFSYALILLLNLVVLGFGLVIASSLTGRELLALWGAETLTLLRTVGRTLVALHDRLWSLAA